MKNLVLGIWLVVLAIVDYRHKEIPLWFSLLGGVFGLWFCLMEARSISNLLFACLPGVFALLFARVTREVMGYGDGIVLVVMGMYLSLKQVLSVGMMAFMIAGIVALVLLVVFHKRGNYRIPFIPFLALAYGMEYWILLGEIS